MHPQRIRPASKSAPPQLLLRRLIGHRVCRCVYVSIAGCSFVALFRRLERFRGRIYVCSVGSFAPVFGRPSDPIKIRNSDPITTFNFVNDDSCPLREMSKQCINDAMHIRRILFKQVKRRTKKKYFICSSPCMRREWRALNIGHDCSGFSSSSQCTVDLHNDCLWL